MAVSSEYDDCKTVLRDVFESEELKIHSDYSATIRQTIEEICTGSSSKFEECFLRVKEGVCVIKGESNAKEPCFRKMYLFLVEKLPELIKSLPERLNDPILWQVALVDVYNWPVLHSYKHITISYNYIACTVIVEPHN